MTALSGGLKHSWLDEKIDKMTALWVVKYKWLDMQKHEKVTRSG
jgi:hypothetical protein